MPLITDPAFYAVAIPAAVLTGIGKSGVAGGFGILAVPLIALVMPVPQAAAIVLPLLTVGDLFGLAALIKERDRGLLRFCCRRAWRASWWATCCSACCRRRRCRRCSA